MSEVWQLTRAYLWQHPARLILTALAMMASACMVIWVVSGYDALLKQFEEFSRESLGRYTLTVFPARSTNAPTGPGAQRYVPPEVIEQLRADPAVEFADPMWSQRAMVQPYNPDTFRRVRPPSTRPAGAGPATRPDGAAPSTRPTGGGPLGRGGVALLGTDAPLPPYPMARGRWIDPTKPEAFEAALSTDAAGRLGVDLGGEVAAGSGEKQQKFTVVGIVDTPVIPGTTDRGGPNVRGPSAGGLYVPMKSAEKILDRPAQASFVSLAIRSDFDITKFRFGWQPKFNTIDPPLQFQNSFELEQELNDSATAENLRMQAYAATGISMLAALFIIFTTLNMGVSERARQFALLRAIALTRGQIAALIGLESLILAIIGWVGGVAAGWGLLWILLSSKPALLGNGMLVGKWSLLLSATCAFGGSLLAAIVPAIRAMRARPLDAIAPRAAVHPLRWPLTAVVAGAVLILINPLLTFVLPIDNVWRYSIYSSVGVTTMAIGFILLAPLAVLITEKLFAPALTALLGIEPRLLKSQLSTHLWRTVGTAVSLTVGLGLYVSMQVWGYTMLGPFEPGPWVPDAMVAFLPGGIAPEAGEGVSKLPGLKSETMLPLAVEQPKLVGDIAGSAQRATVTRQDNIVIVGLDPDRGFGGVDPLLKLHWINGSPQSIIPQLTTGRGVVVPDHFLRETGLKLGDSFAVNPPGDNQREIRYTIAGVAHLQGWHWITKLSGLRLNSGRTCALCFADYSTVAADFDLKTVKFFWSDATGPIDPAQLSADARQFAETRLGEVYQAAGRGLPQNDTGFNVRVMTPTDVATRIRGRADGWIWSLSQLPLVTLAVASIGVLNAILASVRARKWDMGVLRALGFTRSTLIRLVIAEGLLVGVVACLLSFGFGVMAGWCGSGISQYVSFFGGLSPTLVIPWVQLSWGLGGALILCLLAALWPAILTGRTDTLELLQAGRSAF